MRQTVLDALNELAQSPAYEATLTWNGKNEYEVQPSSRFVPYHEGHRPILTRDELVQWCDGDLSESSLRACAQWVESNQLEWFDEAA